MSIRRRRSWLRLRELSVPSEFITYPLDLDERPRVEREDGETMILLRVPFYQGSNTDVPFTTIPMGIVMDGQWIMTVCRHDNDLLRELAAGKIRGLSTAKRNRFILQVLLAAASKYLLYLREINRTVDNLEDQLQMSMQNRELLGLLKYQKSLVYFTTALKANELMMERLHRSGFFRTYPDDEDLLEDVLTENQQAIEMTNIASNILSSMMDAFRLDHFEQCERRDEVPGRCDHRGCLADTDRQPLRHERPSAVSDAPAGIRVCAVRGDRRCLRS